MSFFKSAKDYDQRIDNIMKNNKSISDWAKTWGISRQAASLYFKQHSHLTIKQIVEKRQERGWTKHIDDGKSANDLANELGYSYWTVIKYLKQGKKDDLYNGSIKVRGPKKHSEETKAKISASKTKNLTNL